MGMGASNTEARIAASVGELEGPVAPDFQPALDVPNGGVLFALPQHTETPHALGATVVRH